MIKILKLLIDIFYLLFELAKECPLLFFPPVLLIIFIIYFFKKIYFTFFNLKRDYFLKKHVLNLKTS